MRTFLLLSFAFIFSNVRAQIGTPQPSIWASSLHSHQFGTSQTHGQLPVYFPQNVLGRVPSDATPESPAYRESDVVSIGKGGFIALGFYPSIINGPGPDFTVFENVLKIGSGYFGEWMIVSASMDGVTWYTFPYDSVTGEGLAGHKPTFGNAANFRDPGQSGGDPFDLSMIGLDSAKYIKVTDATHFMAALGCSGCASAELDAIVSIYQSGDVIAASVNTTEDIAEPVQGALYNMQGELVEVYQEVLGNIARSDRLPRGIYILKGITPSGRMITRKIFIQ